MPEVTPIKIQRRRLLKKLTSSKESSSVDPENLRFRLILSQRAGNGKSLAVQRLYEKYEEGNCKKRTLHIYDQTVDTARVIKHLHAGSSALRMHHIDLASHIHDSIEGLDDLLFSLAVLNGLQDSAGKIWLCSDRDYYLAEMTTGIESNDTFYQVLPQIICPSPNEVKDLMRDHSAEQKEPDLIKVDGHFNRILDKQVYFSEEMQRVYQYLTLFENEMKNELERFNFKEAEWRSWDDSLGCLKTLLKYCPVQDNPSWAEVKHFAAFLNAQLEMMEKSSFCNYELMKNNLPGIKTFVVDFLIQMSRDFSSRSVVVSDESHEKGYTEPQIDKRRK